jgi:hypothetical protein
MPFHPNNEGQTTPRRPSDSTDANPLLERALAERERFLKRRPHMNAYQAEIDRVLEKSGTSHNRIAVLEIMIQGKLFEIQKELYKATRIFRDAIRI